MFYLAPLCLTRGLVTAVGGIKAISFFADYCPFFKGRHRITSLRAIVRLDPFCLLLFVRYGLTEVTLLVLPFRGRSPHRSAG